MTRSQLNTFRPTSYEEIDGGYRWGAVTVKNVIGVDGPTVQIDTGSRTITIEVSARPVECIIRDGEGREL